MEIDCSGRICKRNTNGVKNWYFVKYTGAGYSGCVYIGAVVLPKHLVGKKVRFKMEIEEDE